MQSEFNLDILFEIIIFSLKVVLYVDDVIYFVMLCMNATCKWSNQRKRGLTAHMQWQLFLKPIYPTGKFSSAYTESLTCRERGGVAGGNNSFLKAPLCQFFYLLSFSRDVMNTIT
jgi:hypothetical protein